MLIQRIVDTHGQTRLCALQPDGSRRALKGELFGSLEETDETVTADRVLAPLDPIAIMCIGLNYRAHAEEAGVAPPEQPVVFSKGINTLQHPGGPIEIPTHAGSEEVDYECELAVVIGSRCKNVSREQAMDHVLGYTVANDVSSRDWQFKWGGGQWVRSKMFDTFCPLGPSLATPESIPDPNALRIRTMLNDEVKQDSSTGDMIFSVREIVSFLSQSTTLLPGTVILTGTPQGVGAGQKPPRWLREGDVVTVELEGVGQLTNPVRREP